MSAPSAIPKPAQKILVLAFIAFVLSFYYDAPKLFSIFKYKPVNIVQNTVGTFYKVDRVIDGDTIVLQMDSGLEKVRLIGINTPETVDPRRPVECFGKEASNKMKDLVEGKIVKLEYDDTQGTRDTYQRLLGYIYLEDGQMVNRKMVADGYAYEYTYMTPYKYQKEFRELQNFAKNEKRGLWADETCAGKK